jgi:hypothetical protein
MSTLSAHLRITQLLWEGVQSDLSRPHAFAFERVGFLACGVADAGPQEIYLLAHKYLLVADDEYVRDDSVGARIGGSAFRMALSYCHQHPVVMLHVHRHDHRGTPRFSNLDSQEYARFLPSFWNVRADFPVGALLLSFDSAFCDLMLPSGGRATGVSITVVGSKLKKVIA